MSDNLYGLHPTQFAKFKKQANAKGGSVKVPGTNTFIPADAEYKEARKSAQRKRHESLVPMKNTIKAAGLNWPKLKNHLDSVKLSVSQATRLHDSDPDNFLRNIGLK